MGIKKCPGLGCVPPRVAVSTLMALALGGIFSATAGAVTVTTNAEYEVTTTTPETVTDQDGPNSTNSGWIWSQVWYGAESLPTQVTEGVGPLDYYYTSYGYAGGFGETSGNLAANAALDMGDDVLDMWFQGSSTWTDTFSNNSGGPLSYDFSYYVNGGWLSLYGNGGTAGFSLEILLNGSSVWSRTATASGSPIDDNVVLDPDGLTHTIYYEPMYGYYDVYFEPFGGEVALGEFAAGEQFDITYNLDVWAWSESQYGGVYANIGDPFGLGFSGELNASAPIPEPATVALLALGLGGLGVRRWRGTPR
ncbi:MAG: PEP-CTERM sorting domain-containing protein [Candidatus Hydrogenedentes bacterium]|nr:PEP-CTERM sorting domain-containing protein [Candidatus Hydrogenedentota bacterium]